MLEPQTPRAQGLYDPRFEHDACGMGMVADLHGRPSHQTVERALSVLACMDHRGASGAELETGDGAGILMQIPDRFLRSLASLEGIALPEQGHYAVGAVFLPLDLTAAKARQSEIEAILTEECLKVLWWREVPVDPSGLGSSAEAARPSIWQGIVVPTGEHASRSDIALDRLCFVARKRVEHEIDDLYFASLSARTLVYKGMLSAMQLAGFYPDLSHEDFESALALVHSRFSTNTFPSWPLAHPFRMISHNGEINTVQGNRNWMRARESMLASDLLPGEIERILPICSPGASDSASFDEVLELLSLSGRSLPHAILMMIPEAWEANDQMDAERKAFYRYHSDLMEPWDGPAAVVFTDGTVIGGVLDRNGLRPSRYWVTDDGLVVLASEVGVLELDQATVIRKGRLQPGRMFLVDTAKGRIVEDEEIKAELAAAAPYQQWLDEKQIQLDDLPERTMLTPQHGSVVNHQRLFGYTTEELKIILAPMAKAGTEPIGSMGSDAALAVLSDRSRLLYDYFSQLFAQVTNPPLDAIREELVTSLQGSLGPQRNLLHESADHCRQIVVEYPVIDRAQLAKLLYINEQGETPGFKAVVVDGLFSVSETPASEALSKALEAVCQRVEDVVRDGANIVVLSDRNSNAELAPIPSLLLTAAVHHHLVRKRLRAHTSLVVESGDAREVHHIALLIGYGAAAVNPYLAFDSIDDLIATGKIDGLTPRQAHRNYIKAASKGVLKVMSKMGISTVASYTGAQVFEAIGLSSEVIEQYFTGTASRISGIGLGTIAEEVLRRHQSASIDRPTERSHRELEVGGEYQWRREGEYHLFNPRTVFKLQHATRSRRYEIFKEYTKEVDEQSTQLATLRGLMELKTGADVAIPLEEVEAASEIVKRFSTGAMSYGSISAEAHETLAIAMNRLGAKSNTGEGGEDADRFTPDENGDLRRSAIKQVASGRFGVTSEYLVNADDIQIKVAQGAKPGEGGQLPGYKVYPWIAKTRHSTPGVGLISPPPHHDIYSIEDLKQLIHDLKSANDRARVHVKLVAEVGVGTVAAGVSKAHADVVLISGFDGGTGAAPLTSLKHAGAPWELGLAETQQTLELNGLRDRIVVQVDGQMKTGRDVIIGALLGAEEFGFATAPLIVSGCVMMRVCHLDTCPVGIATQNPVLRERFTGKPEFVEQFFLFIAEEVREHLASIGLRSIDEAIGRFDLINPKPAIDHWKAEGLDLSPILTAPESPYGIQRKSSRLQDHGLEKALDHRIWKDCEAALDRGEAVRVSTTISNIDRTAGTLLGAEVTRRYGGAGLPEGTITIDLNGSAGQSLGAFLPSGISINLTGDANDYLGKGLSGGRLVLRPPLEAPFKAEEQVIAGNVALYGATSGSVFISGQVGERFCVRNSGATAVVEGVGDHACEYMTGGTVVVLGSTGRNFGAGMSGGMAFVLDEDGQFSTRINAEMIDLEPLGEHDRALLESLLREHEASTGSGLAASLLSDWSGSIEHFVKVMPRDYRRVLEATAKALAEGSSVDEAVMGVSHG